MTKETLDIERLPPFIAYKKGVCPLVCYGACWGCSHRTSADTNKIGKREDGKMKHGVGGKAFPCDFNWICNVCSNENRGFEPTCQCCEHEAAMRGYQP